MSQDMEVRPLHNYCKSPADKGRDELGRAGVGSKAAAAIIRPLPDDDRAATYQTLDNGPRTTAARRCYGTTDCAAFDVQESPTGASTNGASEVVRRTSAPVFTCMMPEEINGVANCMQRPVAHDVALRCSKHPHDADHQELSRAEEQVTVSSESKLDSKK